MSILRYTYTKSGASQSNTLMFDADGGLLHTPTLSSPIVLFPAELGAWAVRETVYLLDGGVSLREYLEWLPEQ